MPLAEELLDHSSRLLAGDATAEVDYRRAVSAAYYAVFHLISAAVAAQVSPEEPEDCAEGVSECWNIVS